MNVQERTGDYRLIFSLHDDETIFLQENNAFKIKMGRWEDSIEVGSRVFQPIRKECAIRGWVAAIEHIAPYAPLKLSKWGSKRVIVVVIEGYIAAHALQSMIAMKQCVWLSDKPIEMEKLERFIFFSD